MLCNPPMFCGPCSCLPLVMDSHVSLQEMLSPDCGSTICPFMQASFLIELGYLRTLMGDYPRAKEAYNEASELEGGSLEAMVGSTLCQFKMGLMEDALEQLELLNDTQDPSDRIPMHSYVCALAARLVQGDAAHQEILSFLNDALSKLFRQMHGDSIGEDLYVRFNPQMLLQILQEIMNFLPTEPLSRGLIVCLFSWWY